MKRIWSVMLIVVLMVIMITPVYADVPVQDDLIGHWSEQIMREWIEAGLVSGYEGDHYKPNAAITRAEFCTLLNNVVGLTPSYNAIAFKDVSPSDWFYQTIKNAAGNGLISGYEDGLFYPNKPIKREEAAVIVEKILSQNTAFHPASLNDFKDYSEISAWSREAMGVLVAKGYLSGYPDATLRAQQSITRGEVVAMLDKIFGEIFNVEGIYKGEKGSSYGNVTIASSAVTLEDMVVKGDLYIAESVGNGDVTLNNVTVEGDIIVKGGGEHSIHFNNINVLGALVVKKADNKIRIVASGTTRVNVTYLASGALLVEDELAAEGFNNVILDAKTLEGLEVELVGTFNTVEALTEGFKINLSEKSIIQQLNVNDKAKGFDIAGKGIIKAASINADNSHINANVEKMSVGENVKEVTANGKSIAAGTNTNNAQTGGATGGVPGGATGPSSGGDSSSNDSKDDSKDDDQKDPAPLAVLTLSKSSVQMTTSQMLTVTATVQYTTSSMVNANVIWVSQSPKAISVAKNGSEISNTGSQMVIENQLKALSTTSSAIITVYVVKDPLLSDPLVSSNVITSKYISAKVSEATTEVHTIYFEVAEGDTTSVPQKEVIHGQVVVAPVVPTKTGYTFKGWYLDNIQYDFSKPVEKDMTLKAVWEIATTQYIDNRFDTGYPLVKIDDKGYITLSLKLKDTPVSAVRAYIIADPRNAHLTPDKIAVMHGHTGNGNHVAEVSYNGYLEIKDAAVHNITTTAKIRDEKALVAIVLEDHNMTSSEPTIIEIEKPLISELDEYPPTMSGIYINDAKNKIYVYTYDELDGSKTAATSDFKLTYRGKPMAVTSVHVLEDAIKYYDAVEIGISGLASDIQISDLSLSYTGTGITDKAKVPNAFEMFSDENVQSATAKITDVFVSPDVQFVGFKIRPGIETAYESGHVYDVKAYYTNSFASISSSNKLTIEEAHSSFNMDEIDFVYKITNAPSPVEGYKIYIVAEVTTCARDRVTINSSAITPKVVNTPSLLSASYNASSQRFNIVYNGLIREHSISGCLFDIKVVDSNNAIIETSTLEGKGYGRSEDDGSGIYQNTSIIDFHGNYYYGTLPTVSSGMKLYIRYNPKHSDGYLESISGQELKTISDWVEVTIQ
ncbi:S-layer homology domain-containing protein [Fusibacter ferrireducens]|uniref:S-layer homology domain-containing protein n=1 Tax=Fusibacter ferrireducens TaxID=2785058 RepID=A0ABR9ZXH4_9FIRM|nr:S-layer homology domain-containing protein [Fusibacter ferrireducens]MBF4695165.1 S-layer homology domain-containing protein [Fusibacter ferrireducens]